jgi:hypothetical protein
LTKTEHPSHLRHYRQLDLQAYIFYPKGGDAGQHDSIVDKIDACALADAGSSSIYCLPEENDNV